MYHEEPTGTFDHALRLSHPAENSKINYVLVFAYYYSGQSHQVCHRHQTIKNVLLLRKKIWLLCKSYNLVVLVAKVLKPPMSAHVNHHSLSAPLTFMHSNNFSFSSSFPSFAPLPPLTCPPSHSPLSPASPPPRLTGGQALPKSRECCPRLGLGFGLLLPHPPLFKHLPASENIPHCLSLRGGAGYFSKCINSKRATKG